MPTYDYVCDACKHAFEHFQSMNDAALQKCPKCSKKKLRRLIGSGAGIIFKGSGFYITDYKKGGSGEKSGSGEKGASAPSKSGEKSGSSEKGGSGASADDKSCGSCGKTGPDVCD